MTTKIIHKAAALAALYIIDQAGGLAQLTQQELTDALGLAHRSAGGRYLHELPTLRALVPELVGRLAAAQERQNANQSG